uniref:Ig-like domain-containing protein n=1 Tax=Ornithorhynchus anatinus TaxID=9258 RepID=F6Z1S9_ORNAN
LRSLRGPILFSLFLAGSSMAQSISQTKTAASGLVGQTLTLPCTYSTSGSYYYLFWYKQPPTGELISVITQYSGSPKNTIAGRFSVNFQKVKKSISLTIRDLQPGDSAVYFCAIEEDHGERTGRESSTKTSES